MMILINPRRGVNAVRIAVVDDCAADREWLCGELESLLARRRLEGTPAELEALFAQLERLLPQPERYIELRAGRRTSTGGTSGWRTGPGSPSAGT